MLLTFYDAVNDRCITCDVIGTTEGTALKQSLHRLRCSMDEDVLVFVKDRGFLVPTLHVALEFCLSNNY